MNSGGIKPIETMNGITDRQRKISLALTAAIHAINHAVYNMMMPLVPEFSRYFHSSNLKQITLGFSLYLAFYGFGQVPLGFLSDKMPRKTLMGAGVLLNGAAIACAALFPSYTTFLIGLSAAGFGAAAFHPVGAAYLTELYPNARGSALGISGFGATVGLFFGPYIGGMLSDATNWRVTFLVFAAVGLALGLLFLMFAAEPSKETTVDAAEQQNNGEGWSRAMVLFLVAIAAIFMFREFTGWGGYFLVPLFCSAHYGMAAHSAGLINGFQSIGGFVSQPLGGYLSDRVGRRPMLMALLVLVAIFVALIPLVGRHLLVPTVLLYSLCYTATVPIIDALIADRAPSRIRGAVFGIFMASGIGLSSISNLALANTLDHYNVSFHGFVVCFSILAASVLVSATLLFFFKGAGKKSGPKPLAH